MLKYSGAPNRSGARKRCVRTGICETHVYGNREFWKKPRRGSTDRAGRVLLSATEGCNAFAPSYVEGLGFDANERAAKL